MTPTADLVAACCAFTAPFEGNFLWPYLDDGGKPTIGIGHLLYSDLYAQSLFTDVPVSDFREQWEALMIAPPNRSAAFYETLTDLRLTPGQSLALFRSDMDCKVDSCRHKVPGFDALPRPAQIVCADLEYNVSGGVGVFKGFLASLAMRNWESAALNCHRKETPIPGGIQPARNSAARALLMGLLPAQIT